MKDKNCIKAILIPPQIDKFCEIFGIKEKELEVNFDGWHKHILTTKDTVFLFPRNPKYKKALQKELDIYEEFTHLNSVPLPKLKKRVKDPEISYYEFGAITKLSGTAFSKFQTKIKSKQVEKFLLNLSKIISIWHNIPTNELPKILEVTSPTTRKLSVLNWHKVALSSNRVDEAISFIIGLIQKHSNDFAIGDTTRKKWIEAIEEIACLENVLIHGDVHEDQVLVELSDSMEITGVLDWETARIDNPVWDFNFGEWGLEIWDWSDNFVQIRKKMWSTYLKERKISLSTVHGLHLFFTLWEFTWLIKQRKEKEIAITKTDFKNSVKIYCNRLNELNKLIEKE